MPPKILHILLGLGILAGFFPLLTLKPVAAAGQTTLLPAADAYIDCSNPSINYGTRTTLRVDGSPIVRSYLRFDLSAVVGSISQAKLRIYANSASTSGISVAPVTGAWSETVTTCANAPTPGAVYSTSGAVTALAWKEIDVTGLVRAGGSVSLALGTPGSTAISLASRESGAYAPQLVLTLADPTQTPSYTLPASSSPSPTLPATATLIPPTPGATSTPTPVPSPAAITLSLVPEADAYVDSSLPTANYGRGLALRVDGSPTVRSYLRFRVTGAGLPITRALLRIYANSASSSGISLFPVSDTTWSETGVTFANAPLPGSQAALSSAVAAGTWKILDVTSLVSGDGLFSFALGTPGSTAISLASRESSANAPQLVLTFPAPAVLLAAGGDRQVRRRGIRPGPRLRGSDHLRHAAE